MKILKTVSTLIFYLYTTIACSLNGLPPIAIDNRDAIVFTNTVINQYFEGNGFQWGGYDMTKTWTGNQSLSETDWQKLFERVRFIRPSIVRIMVSPEWNYMEKNQFYPEKSDHILFRILDFCKAENIAIIFGEWKHSGGEAIDQDWLENSAKFIEYLIKVKNYSCIKYFNMVNEPNGDWSSIKGRYNLWKTLIEEFYEKLVEKGIADRLKLIGPDVAIWDTNLIWWVSNTLSKLDDKIGAYDIHTYPTETQVHDESYHKMIQAYKNAASPVKPMLMGEIGFKYTPSSPLGIENASRIKKDKFASDDSNMMIYDAFYGIDMADALIQIMRAGYNGSIVWDLDDAMYNNPSDGRDKLKRWGGWNILGAEKFENPADENIRPWFYPMSLLSRYFPQGTKTYTVNLPNKMGLRAIMGEKDGKHTIAIVNSHTVSYKVDLRMEDGIELRNLKIYRYIAKSGASFEGKTNTKGFAVPEIENTDIDFRNNAMRQMEIPARSFWILTNMQ